MKRTDSIESLPILMRGKHRTPRQGACFMEFASYLSGERWSDHPSCTHPLLGALARDVNDRISDPARQTLVELVPEVIGLTSRDLRVDLVIALRAATEALPVVSEERQRVMALALSKCERIFADLEGRPHEQISVRSQIALASAPGAAAWAQRYGREFLPSHRVFRSQTAPAIVRCAVDGIWQACTPDVDRRLRDLLAGAIADCRTYCAPTRVAPEAPAHPGRWQTASTLLPSGSRTNAP